MATAAKDFHQTFIRLESKPTGKPLVHPDLRPKLVADASKNKTSLSHMVLRILGERYSVRYSVTAGAAMRRTTPSLNGEEINLRLPMSLYRAISVAASRATPPRSVQDEIRAALSVHYGLPMPRRGRAAA